MPRAIDHLVLAVPDLDAAVERYRAMGFTVGQTARHPWNTINAVVQLDGVYLELIGLAPEFEPPEPDDPAAPFAVPVAAAVARGGGLALVALTSEDAEADAIHLRATGLGTGRRLDFARTAAGTGGAERRLRFSLAFAELPGLTEAGLFACQHHQAFGDADARRHANGAIRLGAAVLAVAEPGPHVSALAALFGRWPDGPGDRPTFATSTGRLDLMTPADAVARYGRGPVDGRFAALDVVVADPQPLRAALERAGVPHRDISGTVVVPPEAALGAALAFSPAPCHSVPRDGEGTA